MKTINCLIVSIIVFIGSPFASFAQSAAVDPAFVIGSGFNNQVKCTVIQPDGKIICAGSFTSYNGTAVGCITRLNPDGSIDLTFNSGGSGANQGINKVVLQSDGKILIGGHFYTYNGTSRVNIARLNTDGSLDASFNAGTGPGAGMGYVNSLALQTDGKIVVGGWFTNFSGNSSIQNIMRLNSNGSMDAGFGNPTTPLGFDATVQDLIIDFFGRITVVGDFTYYKNGSTNYPAAKIARITTSGAFDASFVTGTGITGNTYKLQVSGGYVYLSGNFWNYNGNAVAGLIKLNDNGSLATPFNATGSNIGVRAVCFLSNGKIMVGGDFSTYNGVAKSRIVLLNSNGNVDATFNPGTGFNQSVYSMALQTDGKVLVGGDFTNYNSNPKNRILRLGFCSSPLERTETVSTCNSYTWHGTTYTSSTNAPTYSIPGVGTCDSLIHLNLTIHNSSTGIDTRTACSSYTWINGVTYTASTNAPTYVLQNAAGCDSTVTLHLTIQSNTGIDTRTACNSYTWINGITYTASTNTPTVVLQNAAGCDSTVTLHLTINHSNVGTDVRTSCDSYTWIDGNTYTSSTNTPTFVLQNASGCDSTVTLHLTINHSTSGTDIQTSCDSYTWIDGNTYTSSTNIPTFVLQNASGCDSTVTLHLTITNSNVGTDVQTSCDSYTWIDGNTYTSSTNTPTFILQNAAGCDSTVTLHLTITNSNVGTDIQTSCDSYTWIDGNTYTSSTNTPTFVLQNAAGCDSTVTLHLTITNSNVGTDIQTSCDSYTWIDGNTYTSSTNTPTFVLQNAAGCDSIVTLNLTIIPSLPLAFENVFVLPTDVNNCIGEAAIDISGNADFELDFDNGSQVITSSGYSLVTGLCAGIHDLHVTDNCGDTLSTTVVIPVDSNFVFNNPFIDSLAQDSLGVTLTNCDIFYNGIDTAYIDSIWANGNTVNVIWNIVDSNGSNLDTTSYALNNGNGVYWLQLSVFCPNKSVGEYFTVTEAIYFNNGTVNTAGLADLESHLFELYPNPTNDQVHINFLGSDAELTVYDAQGKIILEERIQNQQVVSLRNFENGVYLFDFKSAQGHHVQRVVKQ